MLNARIKVPTPRNEPILNYAPGSTEKNTLKAQLQQFSDDHIEIPLIIGGHDVNTGDLGKCLIPHDHQKVIASYHKGNTETVNQAIAAAAAAREQWASMPWEARASIFLKAAELLAGKYRPVPVKMCISAIDVDELSCCMRRTLGSQKDNCLRDFFRCR